MYAIFNSCISIPRHKRSQCSMEYSYDNVKRLASIYLVNSKKELWEREFYAGKIKETIDVI